MTSERPAYPPMPAYGAGAGPTRSGPGPARPVRPVVEPSGVRLSLALSVAFNALTLLGVLVLGWPAGNVFLIFWCENVVLGLVTLVRVATAADKVSTRVASSLFFCVHYGIFCAVHLVFTYLVAAAIGVDRSWPLLALPVVLLLARYGVELGTTWFGARGLRRSTTTRVAMGQPYPRIAVLHLAVLATLGLSVAGAFVSTGPLGGWAQDGVVAVLVLAPPPPPRGWLGLGCARITPSADGPAARSGGAGPTSR